MNDGFSRRQLPGLLGAAALLGCAEGASSATPPRLPGTVGLADLAVATGERLSPADARAALEQALRAAARAPSGTAAVRALFRPDDTVGIKLNCLAGRHLSPRVELVGALVELLAEAGVERGRIIVFERSSRELEGAGFAVQRTAGPNLCFGIDNDFERVPETSGEIGSCFARLVASTCTALVSFGVVKDHDLAGVSGGLKNWYGVIHNPNKYHTNNCDPYVADVVRHRYIRDKLRLTVLDGVMAQCRGGPAFLYDGLFPLARVAASTDPVAIDAWAWNEIDAERKRRGLPSLEEEGRPPRFLATAAGHGLGVADREKVELVTA